VDILGPILPATQFRNYRALAIEHLLFEDFGEALIHLDTI
jgi:hypothetical protein